MAIDTREKRASALTMVGMMYHLPTPDTAVTAPDRAQVTWAYSGLSYEVQVSVKVTRRAFEIELYDKNGDLKKMLTRKALASWEYLRTGGCGQADVLTTNEVGGAFDSILRPGDELRIKIRQELRYSGKLLKISRKINSREEGIDLMFYGYITELSDKIISRQYQFTEISEIVKDILDRKIVGSTRVTYSAADIEATDYVVEDITFNHQVIDALSFLGALAGDVEWGVDRNKNFYFKRKDPNVRRALVIGREVYSYKEIENHEAVKNTLYIYGQSQELIATVTSNSSAGIFGAKEQNIFETAISEQSDANRLGAINAKKTATKIRQMVLKVKLPDAFYEQSHPIGATSLAFEPFPTLQKYGNNFRYGENKRYGNFKRDQISSIKYSIVGGGLDMQIVLSDDVPNLGDQQKRVEFDIKELQRR